MNKVEEFYIVYTELRMTGLSHTGVQWSEEWDVRESFKGTREEAQARIKSIRAMRGYNVHIEYE